MLYTFSQAHYSQTELEQYLLNATAQDAVVLWQDGVLLALKQADVLARCHASCFALENDIEKKNNNPHKKKRRKGCGRFL